MTDSSQNKFSNPFSLDEREVLKKWSNLSKSKKLLSPFQRKVLYEAGLFDEIFLQRFSHITDVLGEFSELLDISDDDRDMSDKLWKKVIRNHYKIEVERENDEFYIPYADGFRYGIFGLEEDSKKAIYWYKKAAQTNNLQAQFNIGEIYLNGEGVQSDHLIAREWFEKSSAQGHVDSQYQLACLYLDEDLGMLDQKLGYALFKKASTPSKENDFEPSSLAIVGRSLCLHNGRGVKKNLKESVKFFEKASDLDLPGGNNPHGMFYLGLAHYNGTGVPINFDLAFKFFLMAADQDLCNAEYFVAGLLYYGEGVQQNYSKAIKYYKKVIKAPIADKNYRVDSFFKLGFCYLFGKGIKQNTNTALKYLNKAVKSENIEAKYWLGYYYYDLWNKLEEDDKEVGKKAYKLLKSASDQNIELSLHFLGQCYDNGIGIKQNLDKALICYKKSVLQNNDVSIINIADIYYLKQDVENIPEAFKWYKKAETIGSIEGKFRVAEIELLDEEYNQKELIKKLKLVVNHKYNEDEVDWSKEAQEYINILKSDDLQSINEKKIQKKGNVLYPSIFKKHPNGDVNFDVIEEEQDKDEDEIDNVKQLPKSKLRLVNNSSSKVKRKFSLDELLEKGETAHIEFKQTLFYDVVGNAPGAPEAGILKTVLAFLNAQKNDGLLIVGVKDNNEIFGLETDFDTIPFVKKVNTNREKRDKAALWLRELLRENLKGYEDIVAKIKIEFEKYDDKEIMRITVPKSKLPVYPLPVKKLKEHIISQAFYIKNGNSITELKGAARDRYISEHFSK